MESKIISCDIDGILTDYPNCWLSFLEKKCGTLYSSTSQAKENEEDYAYYKDLYRESDFKASLPMIEYNRQALIRLGKCYDIIFTTSRPIDDERYNHLRENTYNWLLGNGLIFKDLIFKDNKAKFLKDLDISFHIDDEVKYANSVLRGIKRYHYDNSNVYLVNPMTPLDIGLLDKEVVVLKSVNQIMDLRLEA